jgi:hypothetical protein
MNKVFNFHSAIPFGSFASVAEAQPQAQADKFCEAAFVISTFEGDKKPAACHTRYWQLPMGE